MVWDLKYLTCVVENPFIVRLLSREPFVLQNIKCLGVMGI